MIESRKIAWPAAVGILLILLAGSIFGQVRTRELISSQKTAELVADAILKSEYGQKGLILKAKRDKASWIVEGGGNKNPRIKGGGVKMVISAKDCKVLSLSFGE